MVSKYHRLYNAKHKKKTKVALYTFAIRKASGASKLHSSLQQPSELEKT